MTRWRCQLGLHAWGWPRRHGKRDYQTCTLCPARRRTRMFSGRGQPRLTQEAKSKELDVVAELERTEKR